MRAGKRLRQRQPDGRRRPVDLGMGRQGKVLEAEHQGQCGGGSWRAPRGGWVGGGGGDVDGAASCWEHGNDRWLGGNCNGRTAAPALPRSPPTRARLQCAFRHCPALPCPAPLPPQVRIKHVDTAKYLYSHDAKFGNPSGWLVLGGHARRQCRAGVGRWVGRQRGSGGSPQGHLVGARAVRRRQRWGHWGRGGQGRRRRPCGRALALAHCACLVWGRWHVYRREEPWSPRPILGGLLPDPDGQPKTCTSARSRASCTHTFDGVHMLSHFAG